MPLHLTEQEFRELTGTPAQKQSKYKNKRVEHGDHWHASQREMRRCAELQYRVMAGEIRDLTQQPRYPMIVNGVKVCTYIADFRYIDSQGRLWVEDAKGFLTPEYKLKKKLMKAVHGIDITEV